RDMARPTRPGGAEKLPGAVIDDVALERERAMWLVARADDLGIAAVREDIVAHKIIPAVVLGEAAVSRAEDEVILQRDVGTPLVGVESPPFVVTLDVVDDLVPHHCPGRATERVEPAQVR